MIDLKDKRILITGGTRGIGLATARAALESGAHVLVTGRSNPGNLPCDFMQLDFLNTETLDSQITACVQYFDRLDGLVNNAGINMINEVAQINLKDWNNILQVNLTGVMELTKAAARVMKLQKTKGKIVNISSIYGVISREKRAAYSASKSGLIGFTRGAALDLASDGILVNALCPGFTKTELTEKVLGSSGIEEIVRTIPLGRLAEPFEIAASILFLLSDFNSYITGQTLVIDGGVCSS